MPATVHLLANSRESEQTWRFQWVETFNGYDVKDTLTGKSRGMGDGVDLFCDEEGNDCHVPGTQRFYDALNAYFENEQAEIAKAYFGLTIEEEVSQVG